MARNPKVDAPPTWNSPEYIAWAELHYKRVRIRYESAEEWHQAVFVGSWKREDADIQRGPVMSASSGPKDYMGNDVISLFQAPDVETVAIFVLNGLPFLVLRRSGILYDQSGRQVVIEWGKR